VKARELLDAAVMKGRGSEPMLEPSVPYDPTKAAELFSQRPLQVSKRQVELVTPLANFMARVILDIQSGREKENRRKRAQELLALISNLGPAIIKAGQALSSRPDLLPAEYLEELQKLQDRLPPFPTPQAFATIEEELGMTIDEIFSEIDSEPVAAASIGQVYKGRLRSNGQQVAVKVQRPGCEEQIGIDLFILRSYSQVFTGLLKAVRRDLDFVSVIDDFGRLIYGEIDYLLEANNAKKFNEIYALSSQNVTAPIVYEAFTTKKVLMMEWVEGFRLTDSAALERLGFDKTQLVNTLVECSFRQILDNGFFHADPHAGNLFVNKRGQLVYLDFGMMSYVKPNQRYSLIEAVAHLVNRDFDALATLYKRMGFIPVDQDTKPIVEALQDALPEVLGASVSELNFKNVINKLGDVMYKYPFSLPPFYIAIIRCLGVLEGLAIQVDSNFTIIRRAYPYIASLLLTDASPELKASLRQLSMPEGQLLWGRVESLLENALSLEKSQFDASMAASQLLDFLLDEDSKEVADQVVEKSVELADQLGVEFSDYIKEYTGAISGFGRVFQNVPSPLSLSLLGLVQARVLKADTDPEMGPLLLKAQQIARVLGANSSIDPKKLAKLISKVLRDPRAQALTQDLAIRISERAIARNFGVLLAQDRFGGRPSGGSVSPSTSFRQMDRERAEGKDTNPKPPS